MQATFDLLYERLGLQTSCSPGIYNERRFSHWDSFLTFEFRVSPLRPFHVVDHNIHIYIYSIYRERERDRSVDHHSQRRFYRCKQISGISGQLPSHAMAERTVMSDKLEAIQPLGACDATGPDMSRVWMDFRAMKIGGKLYDLMVNHEYKHGIYSMLRCGVPTSTV